MNLVVPAFSGLNLLLAPQRLQETEATVAVDCDFRTGDLRPYLGNATDATVPDTGAKTGEQSIFQYDPTHLIVQPGQWDFVRSPTFFLDSGTNYRRVFAAKYLPSTDASVNDDYIYLIDKDSVPANGLPFDTQVSNARRLGVPAAAEAPGAVAALQYPVQSGAVSFVKLVNDTGKNSSRSFEVECAAAHGLVDNTKVVMDFPGVAPTARAMTPVMDAPTKFTLKGTGLKTRKMSVTFNKSGSPAVGTFLFKLTNHGLTVGDQVLVYVTSRYSDDDSLMVRADLDYTVLETPTTNTFKLAFAGGDELTWTPSKRPALADGAVSDASYGHKVVKLSETSDAVTLIALIAPDVPAPNHWPEWTITIGPGDYDATWNMAATVETVRDRAYLTTYVNQYGDEGAPSFATAAFPVVPGTPVTFPAESLPLHTFSTPPVPYAEITAWRLYRTDELGQWRLVAEIPYPHGATTENQTDALFVDDKRDTELGETLATEGWAQPPKGLKGIIAAPNGVLVGFKDKTICPSVMFAPYAFPVAYRQAVDANVVGLVATQGGIAVLTEGMPVLLTGGDPAGWTMEKLEVPQACVSHRSIVDMGDFGVYASPDGLVAIQGATVKVLTQELMTRAQWQSYNPATILAAQAEGRYIATYVPLAGGARKGFIFDPQSGSFTDLSLSALAFYNDLLSDTLRMLLPDGTIANWNRSATSIAFHWRSKQFQCPRPTNFGAAQVLLADYAATTTLQIYVGSTATPLFVDGEGAAAPVTLASAAPFRLPGGFMAKDYWFELKGTGWVQGIGVANAIDELKQAP